jgi:predicted ATPase/DNA-binding SARP family transcriptional activator
LTPAKIPAGSALEFAVLGGLEVRRGDTHLRLDGERARVLLSYLIVHANRAVSSDELIEAVWRDRPLRDPQNALQACVSRVRAVIGDEAVQTTPNGYSLIVDPGQVDARRFERLVSQGERALAADDARGAASAFTNALELWRDRPYSDLAYIGIVDGEIRRLEELHLAAVEGRAEALLQLGEGPELVAELTALVRDHPLSERLRSQLAVSLYRAGRQTEALQACRAGRRMLREELGLDASPELRETELAILRHDASLGSRSVARPPVPATEILGRERELAAAVALLRRDNVRLLTLTGPGGIGKTRLALALAEEFGDAVFVDLADVVDSSLVASAIAAALGLRQWQGQSVVDAVEQHLRSRAAFLVLDGFEHVIDRAPLVARLLSAAPELKVLVTSRTVLRIAAEHEFPLGPLDDDSAIHLFRERAAAVDPGYALSEDEERAVRDICRRLDGVPLAIELAAARTNVLSPQALNEHLLEGFDVLFAGRRDAPQRHRTLRGAMDWSWALLEEEERRAFARLGVFVGGFPEAAAEAVIANGGGLELVASLADKSLVRREADGRFRMLNTVRAYALERLAERPADEEGAHLTHARYYTEVVESANADMMGPGEREALDRLEAEHGNLGAAFAFAIDAQERDLALRMALASRRFWRLHGHLAEGLAALESAYEAAPDADPAARAALLNGAGILAATQGSYDAAKRSFRRCARLAREAEDRRLFGLALGNLGRLALFEGDYDRARGLIEEASLPTDDPAGVVALENLALIGVAQDDLDGALEFAEQARLVAAKGGSPQLAGEANMTLGRVLLARRDLNAASSVLREALELKLDTAEPVGLADCLEIIGELGAARGEGDLAARIFGAVAALRASVGAAQTPDQQAVYAPYVELTRQALGERRYERAFKDGAALELPAVVERGRAAVAKEMIPAQA